MVELGEVPAGTSPNALIGWSGRAEAASSIAGRFLSLFEAFRQPELGSVTEWVTYPERAPLPADLEGLAELLATRVRKDDAGVPAQNWGVAIQIAGKTSGGVWLVVDVVAGSATASSVVFTNRVQVSFSAKDPSAADDYFRTRGADVLRALVKAWEPDQGYVGTVQQAKSTWIKMSGIPQSGAVTWWSDQFAIPADVPGAYLEQHAGGTLVVVGSAGAADLGVEGVGRVHSFLLDGGFIHPPEPQQPVHT
jgi:hypothetical protein